MQCNWRLLYIVCAKVAWYFCSLNAALFNMVVAHEHIHRTFHSDKSNIAVRFLRPPSAQSFFLTHLADAPISFEQEDSARFFQIAAMAL